MSRVQTNRPAAPPRPAVPQVPRPPQPGVAAIPAVAATPGAVPQPPAHVQQVAPVPQQVLATPPQPKSNDITPQATPAAIAEAASAANAANATQSAAPGTVAATPEPRRRGRRAGAQPANANLSPYHGLFDWQDDGAGNLQPVIVTNEKGETFARRKKLEAVPTDFDSSKHEKLSNRDFKDEGIYLDFQIVNLKARLTEMEARAAKVKAIGTGERATKANKLLKMREKMLELQKQLIAEGCDLKLIMGEEEKQAA